MASLLRRLALLLLLAGMAALPPGGPARAESGLPIPRFVSLGSSEVNLRTGPGVNYPVDWVYVRRSLPVEVIAEFDTWRKIRDVQGTVGWVHQSLVDGRRTGVIVGDTQLMLGEPNPGAPAVARLEPGVIVRLRECRPDWCRVEIKEYKGWLRREAFWGAYPGEVFD